MDKWNKISESLPPANKYIVGWSKDMGRPFIIYVQWYFLNEKDFLNLFTHWMEVPSITKEEEK